jgi:hypothetical protein
MDWGVAAPVRCQCSGCQACRARGLRIKNRQLRIARNACRGIGRYHGDDGVVDSGIVRRKNTRVRAESHASYGRRTCAPCHRIRYDDWPSGSSACGHKGLGRTNMNRCIGWCYRNCGKAGDRDRDGSASAKGTRGPRDTRCPRRNSTHQAACAADCSYGRRTAVPEHTRGNGLSAAVVIGSGRSHLHCLGLLDRGRRADCDAGQRGVDEEAGAAYRQGQQKKGRKCRQELEFALGTSHDLESPERGARSGSV